MSYGFKIDSFSGLAADLKGKRRTAENVLECLRKDPRVSTWDMSENPWLVSAINQLKRSGKIVELEEPYPWLSFRIAR
jgi:hypothetical protein